MELKINQENKRNDVSETYDELKKRVKELNSKSIKDLVVKRPILEFKYISFQ